MLARKFGWLYFIIALEKKGKLSFYSFSLLKSSEETVIVLITKLLFFSPSLASSWYQQVVAVHFSLAADNSLPTSSPEDTGQTRSHCLLLRLPDVFASILVTLRSLW